MKINEFGSGLLDDRYEFKGKWLRRVKRAFDVSSLSKRACCADTRLCNSCAQSELLQILVICDIRIDSVLDDARALFAKFIGPLHKELFICFWFLLLFVKLER